MYALTLGGIFCRNAATPTLLVGKHACAYADGTTLPFPSWHVHMRKEPQCGSMACVDACLCCLLG
jgi:hypothetical protein